ncbi:hypothetical protein [Croceibacter atlanticus]|jgi:hypothetical protein|uniref:Uncharacterized protein n=1 Tax=Croceibacter atlanticus (strain ATCC BAA-628 / JCM 21780 / CIP 108009 / IAM 15332 / KCTC 12090 / HTCC2559) TaxID=216432 RepID=A3U6S0_CROAH|nr:hypothetical protein [Croceibacter atlanticus]EAP87937.1 hypothetical protein CA2559_04240 [Croceibacter atlanticus HTCC2559]
METLENNPRLHFLLKEFVLINYESDADTSENVLLREYNFLNDTNQLNLLFELETLLTQWDKDKSYDEVRTAYFNLPLHQR